MPALWGNPVAQAAWILLACLIWPAAGIPALPSPNLVLVMTDDQGYGDLRCHGNAMIRTPNLDRLHAQSVRLTQFHVDPTCSPTRAALLTGRYSTRTGVWHTIMGRSLMHAEELTLAEVLQQAGYATGMIGKWHLGDNYPMRPQDQGFDHVVAHGGGGIGQTPDAWGNDYFDDTYFVNGQPRAFSGYCTDVFFREAISFIERRKDQPFFLYLATNVPHGPYRVPDAYEAYYREKGVPSPMAAFYGMIENFDENMGRLLDHLRQSGLEENTIVVFLTDNGTAAGVARGRSATGWEGFNAGMRGQKGSEYDGGHRVPCFIRWPAGNLAANRDVGGLTAHIDLFPTLLGLCGVPLPEEHFVDGTSLVPWLRDPDASWPERTLLVHSQRIEHPMKWRKSSVMTDRWRLVNGEELYDISVDPGQRQNVHDRHPNVVRTLRRAYERWWQSLQPRFDDHAWIVVGAEPENPTRLTCHDWHSDRVPWHQGAIRRLPQANGYWMVKVAEAGAHTVTLRHQPPAAQFPLQARHARVKLGDREARARVPEGATSITLPLDLPAGPARLQTWLEEGDVSRGAFFVEIRRLADQDAGTNP